MNAMANQGAQSRQTSQTFDLIALMRDPDAYQAKLEEYAAREQRALEAEAAMIAIRDANAEKEAALTQRELECDRRAGQQAQVAAAQEARAQELAELKTETLAEINRTRDANAASEARIRVLEDEQTARGAALLAREQRVDALERDAAANAETAARILGNLRAAIKDAESMEV